METTESWTTAMVLANNWWVSEGGSPLLPHQARYLAAIVAAEVQLESEAVRMGSGKTYARQAARRFTEATEAQSELLRNLLMDHGVS